MEIFGNCSKIAWRGSKSDKNLHQEIPKNPINLLHHHHLPFSTLTKVPMSQSTWFILIIILVLNIWRIIYETFFLIISWHLFRNCFFLEKFCRKTTRKVWVIQYETYLMSHAAWAMQQLMSHIVHKRRQILKLDQGEIHVINSIFLY